MKEICNYCNQEFDKSEIERHKFTCVSSYQGNDEFDFSNKIPCEVCHELIDFEHYDRHISICTSRSTSLPFLINRISGNSDNLYSLFNIPLTQVNSHDDTNVVDTENTSINDNLENTDDVNDNIQQNMNLVNYNLNLINTLLNNLPNHNQNSYDSYESLSELDSNISKEGIDISEVSKKIILQSSDKCPVCMENFEKGDTMLEIKCRHNFCEECITEWLLENKNVLYV